jgi:hypothetical protein
MHNSPTQVNIMRMSAILVYQAVTLLNVQTDERLLMQIHSVVITNLRPNTPNYHYQIGTVPCKR